MLSHVRLFMTPWIVSRQAPLSITNSHTLLNLMSIELRCHSVILSSVIPFSSCCQSFPASRSFPVSQFFTSGGQSTRVSTSASVLPKNIQDWFPLGWTGWISLQSKGFSRVFSNTTVEKHQFFSASFLYSPIWHPYITTGKNIALTRWAFVGKVMSLLFNMLSRLVIAFFQGASVFEFHGCSHHLGWFWSPRK